MHRNFLSGNLKGRAHLEDLDVDSENIKIDNEEVRWETMNWIHLAQNGINIWFL
jgi:hypothetical protein